MNSVSMRFTQLIYLENETPAVWAKVVDHKNIFLEDSGYQLGENDPA